MSATKIAIEGPISHTHRTATQLDRRTVVAGLEAHNDQISGATMPPVSPHRLDLMPLWDRAHPGAGRPGIARREAKPESLYRTLDS